MDFSEKSTPLMKNSLEWPITRQQTPPDLWPVTPKICLECVAARPSQPIVCDVRRGARYDAADEIGQPIEEAFGATEETGRAPIAGYAGSAPSGGLSDGKSHAAFL